MHVLTSEKLNGNRSKEVCKHYSQRYFFTISCAEFHSFDIYTHNSCTHFDPILLKLARKRNAIPIEDRFKAIGEELAGFFLADVIPKFGEYHYATDQ